MSQCPWKIHWGVGQDSTTQCEKQEHLNGATHWQQLLTISEAVDDKHTGMAGNAITRIDWEAGDRREYTGDWPGPCPRQPCTLHAGHHGRDAP